MLKLLLKSLYDFLFNSKDENEKIIIGKCTNGHLYKVNYGFCKYCKPVNKTKEVVVSPVVDFKPKSKKDELVESLNYLKNKSNKTKQDKESIYTLEMVLKNMK
jgi:hypothetical protein